MADTILASELFRDLILPFLLVFALIFAILEKTEVLGKEKRQINAIVALVVGLMLIAFPYPRGIIVQLMPLLAVLAVIMLIFIMLYTFAGGKPTEEKWVRITFGVLIGLALIIALLVLTGYWDNLVNAVSGGTGLVTNIIFIVVIIAAVVIVLVPKKGEKSS